MPLAALTTPNLDDVFPHNSLLAMEFCRENPKFASSFFVLKDCAFLDDMCHEETRDVNSVCVDQQIIHLLKLRGSAVALPPASGLLLARVWMSPAESEIATLPPASKLGFSLVDVPAERVA